MTVKRSKRRRNFGPTLAEPLVNPLRRWALRQLVPLGGAREFVQSVGFSDDQLATALGLEKWLHLEQATLARAELRRLYELAEQDLDADEVTGSLTRNIDRLVTLAGLNSIDRSVLEYVLYLHNDQRLQTAAESLRPMSTAMALRVLALTLGFAESDIRHSLASGGALVRSGLVTLESGPNMELSQRFNVPSRAFVDRMFAEDGDPMHLLRDTVIPAPAASLEIGDFSHVHATLRILRPLLAAAVRERFAGVNVFVYGAPGTGKTELSRLLAAEIRCAMFEVASADEDGDPINAEQRLRSLQAAQSLLARRPALLVFDETEDVFNDGDHMFGRKSTAQRRKGWMNHALESNPVPTLWLSNSVSCMDAAFLRRFDLVLELTTPPRAQRERLLQSSCGTLLTPEDMRRIARSEAVTPALVTRAARVMARAGSGMEASLHSRGIVQLVENTLLAQGHAGLPKHDAMALPAHYDVRYLNADCDLAGITAGIARHGAARLCLYGPPGTGKSAFGRWIAECLQRPLQLRRLSDIVSPYVGVTERNLARAFRSAENEGAVLMLDEVDGFLRDRRQAQHSWEISSVNEMLTQMEAYSGVFIASTNLMDGLDQAALRRFDLKLRFDYLRAQQAKSLFITCCQQLGVAEPEPAVLAAVEGVRVLTPGDFATVSRRHGFRPIADASELLAALTAECRLKDAAPKRGIGFVCQ